MTFRIGHANVLLPYFTPSARQRPAPHLTAKLLRRWRSVNMPGGSQNVGLPEGRARCQALSEVR